MLPPPFSRFFTTRPDEQRACEDRPRRVVRRCNAAEYEVLEQSFRLAGEEVSTVLTLIEPDAIEAGS